MKQEWKKRLKAGAAAVFAFSLTVTGPMQALAVQAEESAQAEEAVTVSVYPNPQKIEYLSQSGMKLDGTVNVVLEGSQEKATQPKLEEILKEQKVEYKISDKKQDGAANIIISSNKDSYAEYAGDTALSKAEGYVLYASDDKNNKGEVLIVGTDGDGAFNGVMTLKQLLKQRTEDGLMAEVKISDYPNIKLRGYIEGFYGYPWSFEDREGLARDCSQYKMNTYIYAPKDDPYHRAQWRDLYPKDEADGIKELAEVCEANNVSFCWSIHPGDGYNYNTEADYNKMIEKFEQLYSLGVRQFGISYDDLGSAADYARGKAHAEVINKVNQNFVHKKDDVKPLIVVATRYCNAWGPDVYSYWKPFYTTLNEDVIVMWTGASTMSAINKSAFEWPKTQSGVDRNVAVWWNYPVNDYCDGNLMMAPLENVDNNVDNIEGIFLNPMSQADASKVSIFSAADWSWNYSAFERMSSWKRAIEELVPEASEEFQRFADNLSYVNNGFEFDESRYLADKINALNAGIADPTKLKAAAEALKAEFETMQKDVEKLSALNNKNLQEEIDPFLDAYAAVADAGVASMTGFLAAQKGDVKTTLTNLSILKAKLDEAETYTVKSLEDSTEKDNVVQVGEKRIKPMLRNSISQIENLISTTLNTEAESKVLSSVEELDGKEVTLDGGDYSISNVKATLAKDGYIGFNLPKAMKISEIRVESAQAASLELQYSLNGIQWTAVDAAAADGVIKTSDSVGAAYIRVVNKSGKDLEVTISKFSASVVYNTGKVTASTNLGTYQSNVIDNVVDGNMTTEFYSSAETNEGSYILVDLGHPIPAYDLKICYGANPHGEGGDCFAGTKLEISTDAAAWTQVGSEIPESSYKSEVLSGKSVISAEFNANGAMARYLKFSATAASSKWVQVFEVLYNYNNPSLNDDVVSLAEANFDVNNLENMYDGDFTTAATAQSVKDGDAIEYQMTTVTDVATLIIIQDAEKISGAKVSVQDVEGNWSDIGTLDEYANMFQVGKTILKVKLTFSAAKPAPAICEIIASDQKMDTPDVPSLDTDALKAKISEAKAVKQADITDASWTALQAAITAAEKALEEADTQEAVDAAVKALDDVIKKLEKRNPDDPTPPITGAVPYPDVNKGDWFYNYVVKVYEKKLMTGKSNGDFAPSENLVRAQFATILYRLEKAPKVEFSQRFHDVSTGQFYTEAVLWAASDDVKVVTGYTNGNFGPNDNITREQMAIMMYRYARFKKYDTSAKADLSGFPDVSEVSDYAKTAMQWCVEKGIISGQGNKGEAKKLNPQGNTSRAECATIISRFADVFEEK